MAQIVSLSIRVRTVDGVFATKVEFDHGFNIVRGDNTSGKSSLFQAILYGLGAEELLGGKGRKTMQSALRDQVEDIDGVTSSVIESFIDLIIKNVRTIRIRRFVLSETKSDRLIQINDVDSNGEIVTEVISTWIHDKGGASNVKHGFHSYFASFLGLELPNVFYSNAEYKLLYLQSLFPSFIIEQKKGWADFLHTIPYFGIKDVKSRVVEFILDLDVYKNEKLKIELANDLRNIESRWKDLYNDILQLAAS